MPKYKVGIFSSDLSPPLNREGNHHVFKPLSYFDITVLSHCPLFWTITKKILMYKVELGEDRYGCKNLK